MTKPEERCAWCRELKTWEDTYYYSDTTILQPCSCDFITLPKRSGSKSEMPTPREVLERLWVRDLAVTGKVFFIDGTFMRTFIEAKYVLT